MIKTIALFISVAAIAALAARGGALGWFPSWLDGRFNRVDTAGPYRVSDRAARLHKRLFVADLHADALLWKRDLNRLNPRGHIDLPRLQAGNVALQVFAAVTQVPTSAVSINDSGSNYQGNGPTPDILRALMFVQGWPRATWRSPLARALHQARKLQTVADTANGRLTLLRTREALRAFEERRRSDSGLTAGLLAVEGLHALEGRLEHVDTLFDAGYRMMAPAHFFDTDVGGSAHGLERHGLTGFGEQVLGRMEDLGIVLDLAHSSRPLFDEALDRWRGPVVVSHTGVQGTCPGERNLSDDQIRRVAATSGVVGIAFFERAVCGTQPADIVRAIRYVADLVGVEHVALGSDFDGTVRTHFDASGLALLTEALLDDGFDEEEVAAVMGGNVVRVLAQTLPAQ